MPDISIIMRSRNDAAYIGETLRMVFLQSIRGFELINADNASTDGTTDMIEHYNKDGKVLRIEEGKYVPGRVLNKAIEQAKGRIIVLVNADATPVDGNWLEKLAGGLDLEGKTVAVYGRQIARQGSSILVKSDYERAYPPGKGMERTDDLVFSFAAAAFYREIWDKFRFYEGGLSEDIEWCSRIRSAGYNWAYVPEAAVYHSHRYTLKQLFIKTYNEHLPLGIIYRRRMNFLILLKRALAAFARDVICCAMNFDLAAMLFSPFYRSTIFLSSYLGMRKGIRTHDER